VKPGLLLALAGCAAMAFTVVVLISSPRWRGSVPRVVVVVLGGLLGSYLVVRGVAEFWIIDYADPASYRNDWGGPSLIGVFAVHSGPGLAVVVAGLVGLYRRRTRRATRGRVASAKGGT